MLASGDTSLEVGGGGGGLGRADGSHSRPTWCGGTMCGGVDQEPCVLVDGVQWLKKSREFYSQNPDSFPRKTRLLLYCCFSGYRG